ncbi:c-type cytochrome [Thauera linaloolentis]|uniref:Cytochrome c, class IC:cytochrome c, class I n=1 Tax=Thauera linaloolentis (strain DSM 12138 / JCM 21573 / CCUG 41526 / CIP 105981 / IAM 15112 / NBRC 102519 / 47Lol) TaxID=1123367 RepID=N6YYC8_THAL4|nr:c-type cytochrome [Thauera linaloolentis]ENO87163.1 cytochrome c, class IC:cytochrome c, class I [Thauera linaloolentis 47Lol = DSM 12138]MCM8566430.1 cytochrome c4 [Thauera linaloolentis]
MKHSRMIAAAACAGLLLAASSASAEVVGDLERGKAVAAEVCVACHGADGNSPVPMFPKLAGQHADYALKQLQEFASARRQSDIMKPIVEGLSARDMADAAVFFASQQPSPGQVDDPSMLETGRRVFNEGNPDQGVPACAGCHGQNGVGNARYPRLAGQHPTYVLDQMQQFADGRRTNDKRLMQTIASRLGETETRAVAEYIASLEASK